MARRGIATSYTRKGSRVIPKLDGYISREVKALNAVRKALGMSLITIQEKVCLKCDQTFTSFGNHLCSLCNRSNGVEIREVAQ